MMTGSLAIETASTFGTEIGIDSISGLSRRDFAGFSDLSANDSFPSKTVARSGEPQTATDEAHCLLDDWRSSAGAKQDMGGDDEHAPSDSGRSARRRWQILCSERTSVNEDAVSDEDLLAVLLSYLNATNSRNLATQLITRFETFGNVVSARDTQINDVAPVEPDIIDFFKVVRAAGTRLAREEISNRPLIDEWEKLVTYLRTVMAHETVEQFRVLFLDRRNVLIADEVQHRGTIDHTPLYPREVARRALELDASAIIMVHNHPSNHPAPSKPDIAMTRIVRDALERLGIVLHDHIIVSRRGHTSFRRMGLLDAAAA